MTGRHYRTEMLKILVAVVLLGCVGCSPAGLRHHRTFQKIALAEVMAAAACDVGQTMNVSNRGRWDGVMQERNPLLGERPSSARIVGSSIIGIGILAAFVSIPDRYFPEEIKSVLMTYVMVGETYNVYQNADIVDRGVTWCGRGSILGRSDSVTAR